MQRRPLGQTGFAVTPLAFGGNVFGWTADEPTSFALLDAFVDAGGNLIDTADSYSRWVPGHQGGESETIIGRWIARRGRHDDVVIATKVGSDMGLGHKCLRRDYIMRGGRGFAAPAAGRGDRPVPVALGRRDDAARGNARGLCAAHAAGQGQGHRRVEPHGAAPRRGAGREPRRSGCRATRRCSRTTTSTSARASRARCRTLCVREGIGVIPYFSLAAGFLTGKYRCEQDFGKSPRGGGHEEIPERARPAHSGRARRGGGAPRRDARAGRAGVADDAAGGDGADRERDALAQLDEIMGAIRLALDEEALGALDARERADPRGGLTWYRAVGTVPLPRAIMARNSRRVVASVAERAQHAARDQRCARLVHAARGHALVRRLDHHRRRPSAAAPPAACRRSAPSSSPGSAGACA